MARDLIALATGSALGFTLLREVLVDLSLRHLVAGLAVELGSVPRSQGGEGSDLDVLLALAELAVTVDRGDPRSERLHPLGVGLAKRLALGAALGAGLLVSRHLAVSAQALAELAVLVVLGLVSLLALGTADVRGGTEVLAGLVASPLRQCAHLPQPFGSWILLE